MTIKKKTRGRQRPRRRNFIEGILDMKLRKWYIRETIETQQQTVEAQEEEESLL